MTQAWGVERNQEYFDDLRARKTLHHAMLYLGWAEVTYSLLSTDHPLRVLGIALGTVNSARRRRSQLARTIRHDCKRCETYRAIGATLASGRTGH